MKHIFTLLLLGASLASFSQALTGTKTVGASGDYATIAAAVTALNTNGVGTGGVTFNVAAGHTETIAGAIELTATGTSTNPIIFQKSGAGVNPLITAYVGTNLPNSAAAIDGMWRLVGSDYVTINGIDLLDPNTTNPATMEYGYGLFKASVTDGCQNNSIKNCTITLQNINDATGGSGIYQGSVGIVMYNVLPTIPGALTITAASGSNSYNSFHSNTIQGAYGGIVLMGFAGTSPFALCDTGNDVGGSMASTGNTIKNYGSAGTANPVTGIFVNNQWNFNISYNNINNNDGGGVNAMTTLRGIFTNISSVSASGNINYNTIMLKQDATGSSITGIEQSAGSTAASNTINIIGNNLTGFEAPNAGTTVMYGIYNVATPTNLNILNNNINNFTYGGSSTTGTGVMYGIWNSGAATNIAISNNSVVGFTKGSPTASSATGALYPIFNSGGGTTVTVYNNQVDNIARIGTTGATNVGIYVSAGTTQIVKKNSVTNLSIDGTGTASTMYGIQTSGTTVVCDSNTVSNIAVLKITGTGVLYGIYNVASPTNENFNYNTVSNIIHMGTGTTYGMFMNTVSGTRNVSYNTISAISTGGTTAAGIVQTTSSPNVFNNSISDIQSTNSGATIVSGIIVSSLGTSGTARIYNNFISDLKAPAASGTTAATSDNVRGINITATTATSNIKVYYNTVYLNAASAGTNFGSSAFYHTVSTTATTAALDIRNNIFVNNSVANGLGYTTAFRRSGTGIVNITNDCNNNCFYANPSSPTYALFYDGTNYDQTMLALATRLAPRESTSFTELPPFINTGATPYNLHLGTATPTQCESGGPVIAGIDTDFDGNLRFGATGYSGTGSAPDLGADEGNFIGLDLVPPVITYSALGNTGFTTARTLTTSITDASAVPTSGTGLPVLYWKVNAGSFTPATAAFISGNQYTFTFGAGVSVGDSITYYIVAQDANIPPNVGASPAAGASGFSTNPPSVTTAPTSPNYYKILPSIAGTFHVGVGKDYTTLTAAVADYNLKYMTAPVTFVLDDPTYPGETFPINFNQNSGTGSGNFLTIKPNTSTEVLVEGSSSTGLIIINGADDIVFDGSNNGSSSRNLTLSNTYSTAGTGTLRISSLGNGLGANNITIKNCNIKAGSTASGYYAISVGGSTFGSTGADNDNITIQNNSISKAYYGIYAVGTTGTNPGALDNLLIDGNSIGSNDNTAYVTGYGINHGGSINAIISKNEIFNMKWNGASYAINIIATTNDGLRISRNYIRGIGNKTLLTTGVYTNGIYYTSGTNALIDNNVITDFENFGSTSVFYLAGIRIAGGSGTKVYFNSIHFNSTYLGTATGYASVCFYNSTTATNLDVRNNIFSNTMSGTTPVNYAIYSVNSSTFISLNYNDYYSTGPSLGYYSAAVADFAAWKTATSRDTSSLNVFPIFQSQTNLKPGAIALNNAGVAISGVASDFYGIARTTPPDIGAIEFTPPANDAAVTAITAPISPVVPGSNPIFVNLINAGLSPLVSVNFNYQVNGGTIYTNPWTGSLASGASSNVNIGNFNFADFTSVIKVWTSLPNGVADGDNSNDTSSTTVTVCAPLAGNYSIPSVDFPTLVAAFNRLNTCGVGAPVIFNVAAGYTEAFTLAASPNNFGLKLTATGTAANTITFQRSGAGANPLLSFTGTSNTADAGIWLEGSDYVTFDGIDIVDAGTAAATYLDFGLHLSGTATNGCSYNSFKNGVVDLNRNNTSSRGIRLNGGAATSAAGSNNYNKFYNNTIKDVAQGYYFLGTSSYKNFGNEVGNENGGISIIQGVSFATSGASAIGVYASYQDTLKVFNTLIDTIIGNYATYPTTVGIYTDNTSNVQLYGNTIRKITTSAGDPVGINYQNGGGNSNAIYNNTLTELSATGTSGNINSMRLFSGTGVTLNVYGNMIEKLTNAGSGTSNGIYCSYTSSTVNVYANKLNDWFNSGTSANIIYGIFLTGTGNTYNVYNNMVYDLRAPASTGTAPAVSGIRAEASTCNIAHNSILLNYTSTGASNTSAAMYANAAALLTMVNNIFVNKTDVTVGTRAAAFWYSSATYTNFNAASNNNIYFSGASPVAKNPIFFNGTTPYATLVDYQTHILTRDQGAQTEDVPFISSSTPYNIHILPVATVAESNGIKITGLDADIDGDIRFGSTGYAGTGLGVDIGADEFGGIGIFTCSTPAPGNTISTANNLCFGNSITLSLQNATTGTGVNYQWQESATGVSYTNITGATGATYTVTPQSNIYYRCNVTCFAGPVTVSSTPIQIVFAGSVASTTPGTRCGTGSVALGATAGGSGTLFWYSAATGGSPLGSGTSFVTPAISSTTNFYVSEGSVSSAAKTLGSGSTTSISAGTSFLPGAWGGTKTQYIIRASELISAGLSAGPITSLGFVPTTSGQTYQGFFVNIGHTNDATAPTTTFISTGLTQVYAGTLTDDGFLPVASTLNTLTFGTGTGSAASFNWDGVSNIVLSISWSLIPAATTSTGSTMEVDPVGFVCAAYRQRDSYTPTAMRDETSVTGTSSNRPKFVINGTALCTSPRISVTATVTPAPAITATATPSTICQGQSSTLNVSSLSNPAYTYTWDPGTLIGASQIVSPTTNTTYSVTASDNTSGTYAGCVNTATVQVSVNPTPGPVTVVPASSTLCVGQSVQLSASGGNLGGLVTSIGTGTVQNTSMSYPTPYGAYWETNRHQFLYLASELTAAGINAGASLTSLAFDVASVNGSGAHLGYTIKLASTTASALTTSYISTGLVTVFSQDTVRPSLGSNVHLFTTPFLWNGTSNVLVDVCFANDPTNLITYYTNNASVNSTVTTFISTSYANADDVDYCSLVTATSTSTTRPNILFTASAPTTREWTPITGLFTDAAATIPYTGGATPVVYAKPAVGANTYTYSSTSINNCTSSNSASVFVNPLPTATTTMAATEYICPGDGISLIVNLTGTAPWSLTVNDGTGPVVVSGITSSPWTYPVSPSVTTMYSVTQVQDANCTNSANLNVTVDFRPVPAPVITGVINPLCVNSSATLDAGSGWSSYLWSNNTTAQTLLINGSSLGGNANATYSVTVTNQYGCEGSTSTSFTTYPLLTANAGPDAEFCDGFSTQLDATGVGGSGVYTSYTWSPATGLSATNIKNPVANPTVATTYTVNVIDGNGCQASDDVVVIRNPLPVVTLASFSPVCVDQAAFALSGGLPLGGTFSGTGVSSNNFNPAVAGAGIHTISYTFTDNKTCTNTATNTIQVNALPVVTLGSFADKCIDAGTFALSGGAPTGGTYSGTGVTAGNFNPATAGAGTHVITYTYTDGNSCTNFTTSSIKVNALPVVSFAPLSAVCVDAAAFTLSGGTPLGGTYTGTGVTANVFTPSIAGVGTHVITYTYTDGNSCVNFATTTITVNALPIVSFASLAAKCVDAPAFALSGGSPLGGTYTGTGVSSNSFNPATAGAGSHVLTYTYTNGNGCTNFATSSITVNPLPIVTLSSFANVCIDAGTFALSGGLPTGGTYSGTGVNSGNFNPGAAGAGTHAITYTYTNGNSCTNSAASTITVNALPVVSLATQSSKCIDAPSFSLTGGSPAGGTYSGPGVVANVFNPATAGVGTHTITYTYTDGNSCVNFATKTLTVNPLPVVSFASLAAKCVNAPAFTLSGGLPAGGTYSGAGVSSGNFNPTTAGVGTHTLTYTYTNGNGCTNFATTTQLVNPRPVAVPSATPAAIPYGAFTTLNGTANSGSGNYSFVWAPAGMVVSSTTASTNTVSLNQTQNYTLVATDVTTGCVSAAAPLQVVVFGGPLTSIPSVTPNAICVGNSVQLDVDGSGGAGVYTYSWTSTPAGFTSTSQSPVVSPTVTTTYTAWVNDGFNTVSASVVVTVYQLPAITTSNVGPFCVDASPATLSFATPAGGIYTGTSVNAGVFSPAVAGVGTHTITYTYTDINTCVNTATKTITVNALPVVSLGAYASKCVDAGTFALSGGLPLGGTYSGTGVTSGNFNPGAAGTGTHVITYTYTNTNSCTNSATSSITVNPLPIVSLAAQAAVCIDASAFALTGGSPLGGTYSGPGVSSNVFNPAIAGVGTHTITYTYADGNGCSNFATKTITVNALPVVSMTALPTLCLNAPTFSLSGGLPAGGTYSGAGVSNNSFNPAVAGVGTHVITYTYTNTNSCTNFATKTITILPLPTVLFNAIPNVCVGDPAVVLTQGFPAGGVYSGPSVNSYLGTFHHASLGAGTYTITYTYADPYTGCVNAATQTATVNPLPAVTLTGPAPVCVNAAPFGLTGGLPAGGTYTGMGITNNMFYPGIAGVGTHQITYTYSNPATGCTSIKTANVSVQPLPTPSISGLGASYCITAGPVSMLGTPISGGLFSGPGVSGTFFYPSVAGVGTHTITYTSTSIYGCSASTTASVTVNALPVVTFSAMADVCVSAPAFTLSGGLPTGGTYSGPGVTAGSFNPATAGVGLHTITYSYTNSSGCSKSASQTILVNPLPVVTFSPIQSICTGSGVVPLTQGFPAGGMYSGPGVNSTASVFNPSATGIGTFTLTYTYTDGNGCTKSANQSITVNPLPTVSFASPGHVCVDAGAVALSTGTPAGGVYSGPGVTGAFFYPNATGVGTFNLTYTYTNPNTGCTNSASNNIYVDPLPTVNILGLAATYCLNHAPVALAGTPVVGGTFFGSGVSNNVFYPSVAGPGSHTITYSYSTAIGCTNTKSQVVYVYALPTVTFAGPLDVCINTNAVALTGGSPNGGVYSGTGVNNNLFSPTTAGVGAHTLTYTYTNVYGCVNTATQVMVVNPQPQVSVATIPPVCDNAASFTLVQGAPAGGVYSGTGVNSSTSKFNPAWVNPGTYTITYSYTSPTTGCSKSATGTVTVNALPVVTLAQFADVCVNATPFALGGGVPAGGLYTGTAVSNNVFSPSVAGAGAKLITYTYTNPSTGCSNLATKNIYVNPLPTINFSNLPSQCANSGALNLVPFATPLNGTFSGSGIAGNTFNASLTGPGTFNITYTKTDGSTGCTNSATKPVVVNVLPAVTFANPGSDCINNTTKVLNTGAPAGGVYSGSGVTGNNFNASVAGLGNHPITYTYTATATGCSNTANAAIFVYGLPNPTFSGLLNSYCVDGNPTTLTGVPAGGTFGGPGVTGSTFAPGVAHVGTHSITYSYTNSVGCTGTTTKTTIVYPDPIVFLGQDTNICINHTLVLDAGAGMDAYLWSNGKITQTITLTSANFSVGVYNYWVKVTKNGCDATDTVRVTVNACTGFDNLDKEEAIHVFPNPNNGQFDLVIQGLEGSMQLGLYDAIGKLISAEMINTNLSEAYHRNYDLSALPSGVYYIKVSGDAYSRVKKVVVNR